MGGSARPLPARGACTTARSPYGAVELEDEVFVAILHASPQPGVDGFGADIVRGCRLAHADALVTDLV